MTLLSRLTFLLRSQTVILIVLLFWIYFFLLTLVFVLQWLSSIVKFWSCCCLSFHWLSVKLKMGCPISLHWLFLCWLGQSSWSFERCFKGGYFNLSASATASEFCKWVQVGIDAYTPHHRYQVKPHISPWFSAACAPVILHRNHFFVCINSVNLLNLK